MNQWAFRTLILWTIWASTAMIVYVTLYRDTEAFSFLKHDPSKITWLIVGLFIFGVLCSFVLTILLTLDSVDVVKLQDGAVKQGINGIQPTSRKRSVGKFFYLLKTSLAASGEPDIESLLNVELAMYHRLSHTIEVNGNLLITLGLIGTVAGLTLTLTGLTGSLEALGQDQEMLLSGLRKAMAGMGTAFYTTLLGAVLGGVLLRVFAQITDHGVDGLHDSLMRICLVYCAADLKPTLERDIRALKSELQALSSDVSKLEDAFDGSKHAIADFREEIIRLNTVSREQGEPESLHEVVKLQYYYTKLLKEEVRLLNKSGRTWRRKIKELLIKRSVL